MQLTQVQIKNIKLYILIINYMHDAHDSYFNCLKDLKQNNSQNTNARDFIKQLNMHDAKVFNKNATGQGPLKVAFLQKKTF